MKSAFRSGMVLKHLRNYESTYDDIRVYDDIDQEFGPGGDKNVLIQHFETIINEKYHRDHPEGLTGFVDSLDNAFAELESLEEQYSDRKKFQFLTRNLLFVGLTNWMAGHCESTHLRIREIVSRKAVYGCEQKIRKVSIPTPTNRPEKLRWQQHGSKNKNHRCNPRMRWMSGTWQTTPTWKTIAACITCRLGHHAWTCHFFCGNSWIPAQNSRLVNCIIAKEQGGTH